MTTLARQTLLFTKHRAFQDPTFYQQLASPVQDYHIFTCLSQNHLLQPRSPGRPRAGRLSQTPSWRWNIIFMFQFFLQNIAVMYLCCLANHAKNVPPYCPSISCCSFCPRLTNFLKNNAFHISSPPYCRSWLHRNTFDFQVCDALCSSLRILNRTKSWH